VGKLQIFCIAAVGTCNYRYALKVQSAGSWGWKWWWSSNNNMRVKIHIYSFTLYKTLNKRHVDFQDVTLLATLSNKDHTSICPVISRYIVKRIWTFEDPTGCFTVLVDGNHSLAYSRISRNSVVRHTELWSSFRIHWPCWNVVTWGKNYYMSSWNVLLWPTISQANRIVVNLRKFFKLIMICWFQQECKSFALRHRFERNKHNFALDNQLSFTFIFSSQMLW